MRGETGFINKICGTAFQRRSVILSLAIVLVLVITIVKLGSSKNSETRSENNAGVVKCSDPVFKVGTGPILDEFMDNSDSRCTSVYNVNQNSLSVQKGCSSDSLNFFLLWSTAREDWKLKHFRVIDSIFKYHPDARLHIFTKDMTINDFSFYTDDYDIVHHRLEPEKIFKGTPLDRWAQRITEWKQSSNYFSHVTDAMRIALLWKYGGVYLDTDAIVIRNLQGVRNAVGLQHPTEVGKGELNGAVLVFDKMHPFLYYAMHLLVSTYDPKSWDIAGPQVVTKAVAGWSKLHPYMVRWIPQHVAGEFSLPNEPIGTPQVTVFTDRYAFYALAWWKNPRVDTTENHPDLALFRKELEERAYAYHYVNQMVRNAGVKLKKGIYLFDLLQRSCLYECSYDDLDININEIVNKKHL